MKSSTKNLLQFLFITVFTFFLTISSAVAAPPGDPNEFGDYEWRAYCFNNYNFGNYRGFFPMSTTDFDTRDYYNESQSPSTASGYQGQNVSKNIHSVIVKRQGFDCGTYTIDVPDVVWSGEVFVNGVSVFDYGWFNNGQNNIWTGYLGPESTIEYRFQCLVGSSFANLEFSTQPGLTTTWIGNTDTDWFNPANWSQGVPDAASHVVIPSAGNQPIVQGGIAESKNLTISANALLTIADNQQLKVAGNMNLIGSINAENGSLYFENGCEGADQVFSLTNPISLGELRKEGSGNLALEGAAVEITAKLFIGEGTLSTGDLITLKSDADGTACFGPLLGDAEIEGQITVQRYINAPQNGWAQLASPVTGQTFENWNDDFITTGFPGSNYPSFDFNNIRLYDESLLGDKDLGLYFASHITDPIESLHGYQVYLAAGSTNLDVTGEPITGTQDFDITFHSSADEYGQEFSEAHDGWNLVANPYACAVDWDNESGWVKQNLTNAIYVWDATMAQYTLYSENMTVNGGSNLIPSSQAFWVQANAANPALQINETAKVDSDPEFKSAEVVEALYLKLSGTSGSDEIAFRVVDSEEGLAAFPAIQKFYSDQAVPRLGIVGNDETDYAIQTVFADEMAASVPLNQSFPQNGSYTIALTDETDDVLSCLFLEDLETGEWIDLRTSDYTFNADATDLHNRFVLHFGAPLQIEANNVTCQGEADGSLSWTGQSEWGVTVYNDEMNVVDPEGLSPGVYAVEVDNNGECTLPGQVTMVIEEPAALSAELNKDNSTCSYTANGSIELIPQGGNAPFSVIWNDGSEEWFKTGLSPNNYAYTITDNRGCTYEDSVAVEAETTVMASFALNESEVMAGESFFPVNNSEEAVHYFWDLGDGSEPVEAFEPEVLYNYPGEYTLSLTVANSGCADVFEEVVLVNGMTTDLEESMENGNVQVFGSGGQVVLNTGFNSTHDLELNLFNSIGQKLMPSEQNQMSTGEWRVDANVSGVVIVQVIDHSNGETFQQKLFMD